jgi:hypothetical protein
VLQLRCTQKVRDQFGIQAKSLASPKESDAALGNWYVNLVTISRRKTLIFMSERTLLSFLLFGVRKKSKVNLAELFVRGLVQLLEMEGFTESQIHKAIGTGGELQYSKATNRKALGNLNDLQQLYDLQVFNQGGLANCNLWEIMREMNRMPQRNIGWSYSIELVRKVVAA